MKKTEAKKLNNKGMSKTMQKGGTLFVIAILALPIIQWIIFWFGVNINSFRLAFRRELLNGTVVWDFLNFKELEYAFQSIKNPLLAQGNILFAFKNTMIYFSVSTFVMMPLSLIVAFFIYKQIRAYKFFRIVFYLPAVIPSIIMVEAYGSIVDGNGFLNMLSDELVPIEGILGTRETALTGVIVYMIWTGLTTNVLLFTGGMSRIPVEVLEAAKLDGCGPGREVVSLIVPMIWPTLSTQIILAFTHMFSAGGPILLLTHGGSGTINIAFWLFSKLRGTSGMDTTADSITGGIVSAMGLVFTCISVPIILFVRWLSTKVENVEY